MITAHTPDEFMGTTLVDTNDLTISFSKDYSSTVNRNVELSGASGVDLDDQHTGIASQVTISNKLNSLRKELIMKILRYFTRFYTRIFGQTIGFERRVDPISAVKSSLICNRFYKLMKNLIPEPILVRGPRTSCVNGEFDRWLLQSSFIGPKFRPPNFNNEWEWLGPVYLSCRIYGNETDEEEKELSSRYSDRWFLSSKEFLSSPWLNRSSWMKASPFERGQYWDRVMFETLARLERRVAK